MKNIFIFPLLIVALNSHAQVPKAVTTFTWSNEWVPYLRQTNTVDASGNRINSKNEEWDPATSAWTPSSLYSYTNNAAGLEIQSKFQYWTPGSTSWVLMYVSQSTYNANNKIITRFQQGQDSLQDKQIDNYYYDSKGFLTSSERKIWDNGTWKLTDKTTYTNNIEGEPIQTEYQHLNGGTLQNNTQIFFAYHSKGVRSEIIVKRWLGGSAWVEERKSIFGFDIFGAVISQDVYDWVGGKWVLTGKYAQTNYPDGKTDFWIFETLNGSTWENAHKTTYEWFGSGPTGISEYAEGQLPVIYFDFNGRQVEKQKNVLLIEQCGNMRRKVIIQE